MAHNARTMDGHDLIVLTIPGEPRFLGVVRLFVGGLAARLDLGYDVLDDLQLALENILLGVPIPQEVTFEVHHDGELVSIVVGPFDDDPLRPGAARPGALELGRLLTALVKQVDSIHEAGGWHLKLDVPVPSRAGGRVG
jgi:hypothetical protein